MRKVAMCNSCSASDDCLNPYNICLHLRLWYGDAGLCHVYMECQSGYLLCEWKVFAQLFVEAFIRYQMGHVSRCLCNYVCLRMTLYTCNTAFLSTSDFVSMADADGGWLVEFENFIGMTGMDLEHAAWVMCECCLICKDRRVLYMVSYICV